MAINDFPPIEQADENGLLAIGGDLELSSLLLAYSKGIFPWPISKEFPIAWFAPPKRGILQYKNLHISKSMKKIMKQNRFTFSFNTDFSTIIKKCADLNMRTNESGSWITDEMVEAYIELHHSGHAFSVETRMDGKLAGGLYGVCMGNFISGESMFHTESNASKAALIFLMNHLHSQGIEWIDTQMITPVVSNFGAIEISRNEFMVKLEQSQSALSPADGIFGTCLLTKSASYATE